MEQAQELARRFPGSRLRANAFGGHTLVFEVGGDWLDARIREHVALEVFIRSLDAPGVSLTIEAGAGGLEVHQDDGDPITALWLDAPARDAVLASRFEVEVSAMMSPTVQLESYRFAVDDGEVSMSRRTATDVDALQRAMIAAGTLAARPHRIARAWLDVARGLGGTTTAGRWDLADRGGEFAVTIDRSPAAVRIDNVRRLPGDDEDHPGLYTRARARRVAAEGDRWAIWDPALDRAHRPRAGRGLRPLAVAGWDAVATDPARLGARLQRRRALLDAARPASLATIDDTLELWWPGLVQDPARVGPAVELLAHLAAELDASAGPYR